MKVIVVEDERLAAERLITLLQEYDPAVQVIACLESVEETVAYLKSHAHPDLLLLDIHLSDGRSFDIFNQLQYSRPVVFTTAYDHYALEAFKIFSVDYKYRHMAASFSQPDYSRLVPHLQEQQKKKKFLGKVGQRLFFIDAADIAFFQADNKIVHLVDKEGNRYVVDYTMEQLEDLVHPQHFFRLNRSFIVHIDAIQQVKPYYNSRLKLSVKGNIQQEEMIISRERVANFRAWAEA